MPALVLVSSRAKARSAHRSGVTCVQSSQDRADLRSHDRCTQQVRACPSLSPDFGRADLIHLPVSSQEQNPPAFQGGKCWQSLKPSPVVRRSNGREQGAGVELAHNWHEPDLVRQLTSSGTEANGVHPGAVIACKGRQRLPGMRQLPNGQLAAQGVCKRATPGRSLKRLGRRG